MEWLRSDHLLQEQDCNDVLSFASRRSTILKRQTGMFRTGDSIELQILQSDEDWERWLHTQEEERQTTSPQGLTLLLCSRTRSRIPGGETQSLPFSATFLQRATSVFQIHSSIARVINRSSRATFTVSETVSLHDGTRLIVYNCRSAADWENDMALSVTYSPKNRATRAVLYGCADDTKDTIHQRLSLPETTVCHPLTLPTLFADLERERLFSKVEIWVNLLVTRSMTLSRPTPVARTNTAGGGMAGNHAGPNAQHALAREPPEDLMQLWLQVGALKRGLQTWTAQLQKMLTHCRQLNSSPAADHTTGETPQDFAVAGVRIEHRLIELMGEYDEKTSQCAEIIDGVVLAAQLEWNNIGQADARTNVDIAAYNLDIAKATQSDSRQMRSIALLTMIFLPATFVATLFSMGFFNWSPDQGQQVLSPYFWVYFAVTAAFTCLTMTIWYLYSRIASQKQ